MVAKRRLIFAWIFLFATSMDAEESRTQTESSARAQSAATTKQVVAPNPPVDSALLDDLSRIRRQMGGGVLRGTMLNTGNKGEADRDFQSHLESLLGQEEQAEIEPKKIYDLDRAPKPGRHVQTLRNESEKLERIANQLERIRQYSQADELRSSAKSLRELARMLDLSSDQDLDSRHEDSPAQELGQRNDARSRLETSK